MASPEKVGAAANQPIPDYEATTSREPAYAQAVAARRRLIGYMLGAGTIFAATGFFAWSISELDLIKAPNNPEHMAFAIAKLTAHAVITVAFMFFVYSVLRVSERMVIPHWWRRSFAKLMLGVRDPSTNALRLAKQLTELAEKLGVQLRFPDRDEKKK
jgi:hypothetical protein